MQLSRDDLFDLVEELETKNEALMAENLAMKEKIAKLTKDKKHLQRDFDYLNKQLSDIRYYGYTRDNY